MCGGLCYLGIILFICWFACVLLGDAKVTTGIMALNSHVSGKIVDCAFGAVESECRHGNWWKVSVAMATGGE